MSGWPLSQPGFDLLDRFDTATSFDRSVTVTASGTAHTKGSWVELDASTSQDAHLIDVRMSNSRISGTDTGVLVDLGIGASGSEMVLISNMLGGWKNTDAANTAAIDHTGFHVYIPAGTRLSARCQAVIISDTVNVGVRLLSSYPSFNADLFQGGNVITYGADTANSRGTLLTESGTANVKGTWVEMTSSSTEPHSSLAITVAGHLDVSQANVGSLIDIGYGAASSEQVLIKDIRVQTISLEAIGLTDEEVGFLKLPHVLASGTRLVVRVQATSYSGDLSVCLHGVT